MCVRISYRLFSVVTSCNHCPRQQLVVIVFDGCAAPGSGPRRCKGIRKKAGTTKAKQGARKRHDMSRLMAPFASASVP